MQRKNLSGLAGEAETGTYLAKPAEDPGVAAAQEIVADAAAQG